MSSCTANSKQKEAMELMRDIDFKKYFYGATYVPLESAMHMQSKMSKYNNVEVVIENRRDDNNENLPDLNVNIQPMWPQFIYPCQHYNSYGCIFPPVPSYNIRRSDPQQESALKMLWILSSLLTGLSPLWKFISSMNQYRTSQWHGWVLSYLSQKCFKNISSYQQRNDPYKKSYLTSFDRIVTKFQSCQNTDTMKDVLSDISEIKCVECNPLDEDMEMLGDILEDVECDERSELIIVHNFYFVENEDVEFNIEKNGIKYELCCICKVLTTLDDHWDGVVMRRHGGIHSKFWKQRRFDLISVQCDEDKDLLGIDFANPYTLGYKRKSSVDVENLSAEFLASIGGQKHMFCCNHKVPLITSTKRSGKCNCGRKEWYCCSNLTCNVSVCKRCADSLDHHGRNYISMNNDTDGTNMESSSTSDDEGDSISNSSSSNDEEESSRNDDGSINLFRTSSVDENNEGAIFDSVSINGSESNSDIEYDGDLEEPYDMTSTENLCGILQCNNYDEYVTTTDDPDMPYNEIEEEESEFTHDPIPTSNIGEYAVKVMEDKSLSGAFKDMNISGHCILNQCGSLLTQKKHQLKGSSLHKWFLERICSVNNGKLCPLLYPEAMLFPSIFYCMVEHDGAIAGAIPSALLSECITKFGFQSIPQHVRSRLSSSLNACPSDRRYASYCFDKLTNLSCTHEDTRVIMNRGLTSASDKLGGLTLRSRKDSALHQSIDSTQNTKNLCASQPFHPMDMFVTLSCNQKKHFGTAAVKTWIDGSEWNKNFPGWNCLSKYEKDEITTALKQSSASLMCRIWQEVTKLFIDYIKKSKSSPFKSVESIFARCEYQKEVGNLSHIHLILQIMWRKLSSDQKKCIHDLIRASVIEIVRSDKVEEMVESGVFQSMDDYKEMINDGKKFLPHKCNSRCQACVAPGVYKCRKLDNLKVSRKNTQHTFMSLPNNISNECKERLAQIGLAEVQTMEENGYMYGFKSSLCYFHPKRHIPPTNPNGDMNISPVVGELFSVCRSMQNVQQLTDCGGVNKYVNKYITKMDEQNYVVINVDGQNNGALVTKGNFLHNTKVTGSKINEDKDRKSKRGADHAQGRSISLMEQYHHIFKYPEVFTDLRFANIPTVCLELRSASERITNGVDGCIEDGAYIGSVSDGIRNELELEVYRQHTENELLILEDVALTNLSIDSITQFSLRPPELRDVINKVGIYFRWFTVAKKKLSPEDIRNSLTVDLRCTFLIDGLEHQIKVRRKALHELSAYLEENFVIDEDDFQHDDDIVEVVKYLHDIKDIMQRGCRIGCLDEDEREFYDHVVKNIVDEDEGNEHLPVPVYSYTKPTMPVPFLIHILLSMGSFSTELDLFMHTSLRESLRYAQLIGPSNEESELQEYSNDLLKRFITEQMIYFPNSLRVVCDWIVIAGELFDSVIVHDSIPVTDLPPVQHSTLFAKIDAQISAYRMEIKANVINSALKELGDRCIALCNIPTKEELMNSSKGNRLSWDCLENFTQTDDQPDESYEEQRLAIKACKEVIDSYANMFDQDTYTKCFGIRGSPGSGKTYCSQYMLLYAISIGLNVLATALLAARANYLGGKHWHHIFCLPIEDNLSVHRCAELAILKLLKNPKKLNFLMTLDVILADEIGQNSSEFIQAVDIILRRIRDNNIFMGGVMLIGTLDHTQIKSIKGHPFLTSVHMITSFKMVQLFTSVRASNDVNWQRIQQISRYDHKYLQENENVIEEFADLLLSNCTFVDEWNDRRITPSTIRLYGKRVPALEASKGFVDRVKRIIPHDEVRERHSEDVEKSRYSHKEWNPASDMVSKELEKKCREPGTLLFFRMAVYECTFNEEGKHSHSQMALLYDLPSQEDVKNWKKIKILVAPPGTRSVAFDGDLPKQYYLDLGFKEITIGTAPQRIKMVGKKVQAQRKQYGLKHRVSSTIHGAMGDTLMSMATEVSKNDSNYRLWDKGMLVVLLSRTKYAKDSIFVGNRSETLLALKEILLRKTMWCNHIEKVLELITINSCNGEMNGRYQRMINSRTFPYRIRDIPLPQCNTGFVYMLISIKKGQDFFCYIGETVCLRTRLKQHNRGVGSSSTTPSHLGPYSVFAFICGFGGRKILRENVEYRWKVWRDRLIRRGINDVREWARCGEDVIRELDGRSYNIDTSELKLVCLFR